MSTEVLASLQSLEQLEERVSSILADEYAKVRSIEFDSGLARWSARELMCGMYVPGSWIDCP